jgi:DNA-binding NtrC family response regulator
MKKHILTIDDEVEIRDLLREVLVTAGYRVTDVGTTVEALEVVRTDPPELVITDLQLEENDGFDLADQVKAAAPNTPIVLLTGVLFDPEVMEGPLGKKIAVYIEKTAPLERILREVKRLLPS